MKNVHIAVDVIQLVLPKKKERKECASHAHKRREEV